MEGIKNEILKGGTMLDQFWFSELWQNVAIFRLYVDTLIPNSSHAEEPCWKAVVLFGNLRLKGKGPHEETFN